jgi:cellulose synthase/poly-beta-1,6-N-acetylglucosamine synthase-like glycosyltransferase
VLEITFWICVAAVAYNYIGYPLLLFIFSMLAQAKSDFLYLIRRSSRRCPLTPDYLPRVALLVSAYNEEAVIAAKVKNVLALNYPTDHLEVLFGLDAPADGTAQLLKSIPCGHIQVCEFPVRRGKLAVISDLAERTSAEILVFTDANTMLDRNSIRNLVRHFADSRVGAASGEEIRVAAPGTDPGAESLYWRYESALKVLESRLNCSLGGNGGVLAVRRSLFHLSKQSIVEDFQIPLDIRFHGHRVVYDPEAIAVEEITPSFSAQFGRRVRIGAGNYQTLFASPEHFNPRHGLLTFSFFSHRVLRWFVPLLLVAAFVCSLSMVTQLEFALLFLAQCAFYGMAGAGYYWKKKRGRAGALLSVPFHFCLMNVALLFGLFRYLAGKQALTWKPTPRQLGDEIGPENAAGRRCEDASLAA